MRYKIDRDGGGGLIFEYEREGVVESHLEEVAAFDLSDIVNYELVVEEGRVRDVDLSALSAWHQHFT